MALNFGNYLDKSPKIAFDVDVGVILNGISPSGTSFILGAATYFGDWKFRRQLLNTADKAGVITLAMRTNVKR